MDKEIRKRFKIWWHDEGKFQVPPTSDYLAVKELCFIAWCNGAYVAND